MRQERLIDTCRNKKTQTNETYWLFRHIWSNRQSDQRNIKKRPRWHLHLDGEEITRAITVCKMCRKRFVFWEKETYKRELKGIQTYVTSRAIALRTCRLTCQACQTRPTDMNRNQHKRPGDKTWKRDQQTWKKDQQTRKRDQQKWKRDLQTRKRDLQTWKKRPKDMKKRPKRWKKDRHKRPSVNWDLCPCLSAERESMYICIQISFVCLFSHISVIFDTFLVPEHRTRRLASPERRLADRNQRTSLGFPHSHPREYGCTTAHIRTTLDFHQKSWSTQSLQRGCRPNHGGAWTRQSAPRSTPPSPIR